MSRNHHREVAVQDRGDLFIYGGVALGLLAGAAISTYVWRQRVKCAEASNLPPLEKAEKLIEACEKKLDSIEKSMRELQEEKK